MNLEDIQQAIAKLSPEDRAKLRLWLVEFEAGLAEREPETRASKFGRLAGRAVADFRAVFRAMGAPQGVPGGMIDRIYAVCQGDLFAQQLAELLSETPNASLTMDDLTGLSQALAKIVMARLDRLGA